MHVENHELVPGEPGVHVLERAPLQRGSSQGAREVICVLTMVPNEGSPHHRRGCPAEEPCVERQATERTGLAYRAGPR